MSEKIFTNIRLGLKVDTLANWQDSSLILKKGEVAFATVAAEAGIGLTEPVCMMKIGDGEHTFSQLDFNFYAKSSDVLAACKDADTLTAFINGVIADAGIATDEAMQALAGRVTTAEGKITTLEGEMDAVEKKAGDNETAIAGLKTLVGDSTVAAQIQKAITDLDLANTYEAKGEAAKVSTALETYKTSNDAAVAANTAAISAEESRAKAAEEANANAIAAIKDGTTIDSFADVEGALAGKETAGAAAQALTDAKAYADGLADNYDAKGSAAQALIDAKAYADGLAEDYDAAGSAAQALTDAKAYTNSEMTRLVGDKTVGTQITEAITGLDLANTYDAKGAAAAAETAAKAYAKEYADGLDTAMNTRVEALEAIDHSHTFVESELNLIQAGDVAKWNAAEQNAKSYADGLDAAMDLRVDALEAKFGAGEGNVESQIEAAVSAEAELREAADAELQEAIDALEELVGDKKVSEAIAAEAKLREDADAALEAAIAAEQERAEGVEAGLQTQINTIMNNPDTENVINSINEFTQYIEDHGEIAEGLRSDIDKNAKAIADEAARAAGVEGGLDTRLTAAEAAVATKAEQADLEALIEEVEEVEGRVTTLEGEMDTAQADITSLKGLVGDKKVSEQISAVVDPVVERVATLERDTHTHANAEELAKFADGDKAKLDAAVQTVAAETGLTATKTGTEVTIGFDDECVFIFDCGSSAE